MNLHRNNRIRSIPQGMARNVPCPLHVELVPN
jgi:hypothetical protein